MVAVASHRESPPLAAPCTSRSRVLAATKCGSHLELSLYQLLGASSGDSSNFALSPDTCQALEERARGGTAALSSAARPAARPPTPSTW